MIMEKHVFILSNKAYSRLMRGIDGIYYFDSLYVREPFRRLGIGTKLLFHAIGTIQSYPELDIRKISTVAHRIASKAGYRRVGASSRYNGCELWIHSKSYARRSNPLTVLTKRVHRSASAMTTVYYLEDAPE